MTIQDGRDHSGLERPDAPVAIYHGIPDRSGAVRWLYKDRREVARCVDLQLRRYRQSPYLGGWIQLERPLDLPALYDLAMGKNGAHRSVSEIVRWKHAISFMQDCGLEAEVREQYSGDEGTLQVLTLRRDLSRKNREVREDGGYVVDRLDIGLGRENQFVFKVTKRGSVARRP